MPFPLIWHGIIGFLIEMYKENKKKQIINKLSTTLNCGYSVDNFLKTLYYRPYE